jgi:hypothetical protein
VAIGHAYATNLVRDWEAQLIYLDGLKGNSAKNFADDVFRLLNHAQARAVGAQEGSRHRASCRHGPSYGRPASLSPATVGSYCAAWRSFQNFMLELDRVNEIVARVQFAARRKFVTDENSIAVKKYKAHWVPKAWALTPEEIDAIDAQFVAEIKQAYRVAEQVAAAAAARSRHVPSGHPLRAARFRAGDLSSHGVPAEPRPASWRTSATFGTLTVTGKNDVTGTIPMREPACSICCSGTCPLSARSSCCAGKTRQRYCASFEGKKYLVTAQLLFPSERGGVICPQAFRKRLKEDRDAAGVIRKKADAACACATPGCTLMVPVYSPEIAQKYMRHKNLFTTLYYYHPQPLDRCATRSTCRWRCSSTTKISRRHLQDVSHHEDQAPKNRLEVLMKD